MTDLPAALIAFASLLDAQPGLVGKIARRDLFNEETHLYSDIGYGIQWTGC